MEDRHHFGKTSTSIVHRQETVIAKGKLIDLGLIFDSNIHIYMYCIYLGSKGDKFIPLYTLYQWCFM